MAWALVTGASSGIGAATTTALAKAGFSVVMVGRREERLLELQRHIESTYGVAVCSLVADIRDQDELGSGIKGLKSVVTEIEVLVNNAGLALGVDKMQEARLENWETMIDTNIKGLLFATHLIVPHMVTAGRGHIVNIGSVAGRWVYPGGGVYCATKFAVRALSEGLRMDLLGTGVRVTNIEPGMVETEFSDVRLGSPEKAKAVYAGMTPLSANDIAEAIIWSIQRPQHVNIQELVIFPTDQAGVTLVHRKDKMP